jgi:WD40 repeat protein
VQIMVWSLRTGRLLDVLSGHEGPVYGLSFSPTAALLASSSWDRTVRTWDVFEAKGAVEPFQHTHDVLTVAYRPDGKQICSSTLDGATRRRRRPSQSLLRGDASAQRLTCAEATTMTRVRILVLQVNCFSGNRTTESVRAPSRAAATLRCVGTRAQTPLDRSRE